MHILVTDKMKLLQDINDVDLIIFGHVPFDDFAVFFVERFDLVNLKFPLVLCLLISWVNRDSSWREETIPIFLMRSALVRAEETDV